MESNNFVNYYKNLKVAVFKIPEKDEIEYPKIAPYHPSISYPEYQFSSQFISKEKNYVYDGVRKTLKLLGLDQENFGKDSWNPLSKIIQPGDRVLIKPNFVLSSHEKNGNLYSIITHPAVVRAIVDYCFLALGGKGEIIIADSPQMDCNFKELLDKTKLEEIKSFYHKEKNFPIKIYDLRNFWAKKEKSGPIYSSQRKQLPGDPEGNVIVNVDEKSEFYGMENFEKFYGADYNREETIKHHRGDIQEYCISKTVLSADVIISVPKLKVHKKTGVTLNVKGFVGTATDKNFLVHYILGTPSEGGDQFPEILENKEKFLIKIQRLAFDKFLSRKSKIGDFGYSFLNKIYKVFLKPLGIKVDSDKLILDGGNWYGNDTTWRMAVDLAKIIYFSDKEGKIKKTPQRKIFSVIDGIIGGEGEGPLIPTEKKSGVIIAGFNPVAVDLAAISLMGFDWNKIKIYPGILKNQYFDFFINNPEEIKSISNFEINNYNLNFIPPLGWKRHIEIKS